MKSVKILKLNDIETAENLHRITNQYSREIEYITPKEVIEEIQANINPKKAPGYDLISGKTLKQLPSSS